MSRLLPFKRSPLADLKAKLKTARQADKNFEVFGADTHHYRIGSTVSESDIAAFESRYGVELPESYRTFLTAFGNGSPKIGGSGYGAAGPFYGIYALGQGVDDFVEDPETALRRPAVIRPDMDDAEWEELAGMLIDDPDLSDEEYEALYSDEDYDAAMAKVYAGILPLGTQGCSAYHGLVLTGPHKGRVVNVDMEHRKPNFAYEPDFLTWYERWLDEVISGILGSGRLGYWFGYLMGGDDAHLLKVYDGTDDRATKLDALLGLGKLFEASEPGRQRLLELCDEDDPELRHLALRMLTKFDYPKAKEPLRRHLDGDEDDLQIALKSLHWHARGNASEWVEALRARLSTVDDAETFRFSCYLLEAAGMDLRDDVRPFCSHRNPKIRVTAFRTLGKAEAPQDSIELFLKGLDDPSPVVVHAVLQALPGVRDLRLKAAYGQVLERFDRNDEPVEPPQFREYVLVNLEHRLRELGIESLDAFRASRRGGKS